MATSLRETTKREDEAVPPDVSHRARRGLLILSLIGLSVLIGYGGEVPRTNSLTDLRTVLVFEHHLQKLERGADEVRTRVAGGAPIVDFYSTGVMGNIWSLRRRLNDQDPGEESRRALEEIEGAIERALAHEGDGRGPDEESLVSLDELRERVRELRRALRRRYPALSEAGRS